jgi:hypothetical protein
VASAKTANLQAVICAFLVTVYEKLRASLHCACSKGRESFSVHTGSNLVDA